MEYSRWLFGIFRTDLIATILGYEVCSISGTFCLSKLNCQKGINMRAYNALPEYLYPGMQTPKTRLDIIETFGLGRISNSLI